MSTSNTASFSSTCSVRDDVPHVSTLDVPKSAQATTAPQSFFSSLLLLNARSLYPSANSVSRWKLHDIIGHVKEKRESGHLFPFIAITESWLKSYFSDAQLQIPGYSISRGDRSKGTVEGSYSILYHHSLYQLQRVLMMVPVKDSVMYTQLPSLWLQLFIGPLMQIIRVSRNCLTS